MSDTEADKKAGADQGTVVVSLDNYRINNPSQAPFGAKVSRFVWGGEAHFQNYCRAYNNLVEKLEICVMHGDLTLKEAQERLEQSREF